jgi:hypothetical protein
MGEDTLLKRLCRFLSFGVKIRNRIVEGWLEANFGERDYWREYVAELILEDMEKKKKK